MSLASSLTDYSDRKSIGSRLRNKRLKLLIPIIRAVYKKYGKVNIIDVGGTKEHWNILSETLLAESNIHITLANPYESNHGLGDEHFSYVEADGCDLFEYQDNAFHIAYSNSVIEHVGDWAEKSSG